jgi:hypothetical protein
VAAQRSEAGRSVNEPESTAKVASASGLLVPQEADLVRGLARDDVQDRSRVRGEALWDGRSMARFARLRLNARVSLRGEIAVRLPIVNGTKGVFSARWQESIRPFVPYTRGEPVLCEKEC